MYSRLLMQQRIMEEKYFGTESDPPEIQTDSFGSEVYALLDTPKGLLVGTLSGLYSVKSRL